MGSQPQQVQGQQGSIKPGAWVCILEGPMQNQWGRVVRVKQRSRLVLEVTQEDAVWIVELDRRWIAGPFSGNQ